MSKALTILRIKAKKLLQKWLDSEKGKEALRELFNDRLKRNE